MTTSLTSLFYTAQSCKAEVMIACCSCQLWFIELDEGENCDAESGRTFSCVWFYECRQITYNNGVYAKR